MSNFIVLHALISDEKERSYKEILVNTDMICDIYQLEDGNTVIHYPGNEYKRVHVKENLLEIAGQINKNGGTDK
ncbi:MAG: hypothetical protein J6U54_07660 [Clostridiales bacterium]|nr:hypothetical protein [Clostridiales bacterium]